MNVTVYQTNSELLSVDSNVEKTVEKIRRAREKGADLIVFPELELTGYLVHEKFHKVALRMDSKEIGKIASASRGTAAVVGFIEESKSMNFYNAALVAVDGEVRFAYRKINLPNYGNFEEGKWFSKGKKVRVFEHCGFNCAVFICNDMWHPSIPYLGVCQKANVFITLMNSSNDSMGDRFDNKDAWENINTFYSRVFGVYNICSNRAGRIDLPEGVNLKRGFAFGDETSPPRANDKKGKITYWGGSEIIDPFGTRMAKARYDKTDAIEAKLSMELIRKKKIILPYLREDDPFFTHRELDRILRYH